MSKLSEKLFTSDFGKRLLTYVIPSFSSILPLDKVLETDKSIVFKHPSPQHRKHLLVFPKKRVENINNLAEEEIDYVHDMLKSAEQVIEKYKSKSQFCKMDLNNSQGLLKLHIYAD